MIGWRSTTSKSLLMHLTELYPLSPRNFPERFRLTPSRPDAILITPYQAKPTSSSPSSSRSHYALCSKRNATQRTSVANHVRQPHQLNANRQHVHLIEIKYCEDTRPGQQLEAAQRQHANLCNLSNTKAVTFHTMILGVGGTYFKEHTLNQFEPLMHAQGRDSRLFGANIGHPVGKEKKEDYTGRENFPTSIKEKETHWLLRSMSPLHHKGLKQKVLTEVKMVSGSTRLQNLVVRSVFVLIGTPCCKRQVRGHTGQNGHGLY
eukprot:1155944-Pelagomonas_calceolata.AAC.2